MKTGYHSGKLVFGHTERLGKRIAKARKWYGMSQDELAVMALVSKTTISAIENGDDCYVSTVALIAQGLDIPLDRFFRELPELRR